MDDFGNELSSKNGNYGWGQLGQWIWFQMNYYGMFDASYFSDKE